MQRRLDFCANLPVQRRATARPQKGVVLCWFSGKDWTTVLIDAATAAAAAAATAASCTADQSRNWYYIAWEGRRKSLLKKKIRFGHWGRAGVTSLSGSNKRVHSFYFNSSGFVHSANCGKKEGGDKKTRTLKSKKGNVPFWEVESKLIKDEKMQKYELSLRWTSRLKKKPHCDQGCQPWQS